MLRSLLLIVLPLLVPPAHARELATEAERSGFLRTGRLDEVGTLCAAFARRWPEAARCDTFGTSPEGRPMHLLVVSRSGALTPADAAQRGLPVVLMQGGIHAGEIDGKDAGFLALREVLQGRAAAGALEHQVLLFVPVFNVDGHERFGAWNRPNQRGPEQMGWRTTARNLNLNRDYIKADAPEMRAMLALMQRWDPLLLVDLHATNGAQFEHDISIQVEPLHGGDETLRGIGRGLRDAVMSSLQTQGSLPLPFYPSFVEHDNPASGFVDGVAPPRFSTGYPPMYNRLAMLVETHSWKPYPTRVRITRNTIVAVLEQIARRGRVWREAALEADRRTGALAGQAVALEYTASDAVREIEFRGYAYTRTPSEVSGALMTRYDESSPQRWRVPLRDEVRPSLSPIAPRAGYLVPAAQAALVEPQLRRHGIEVRRLAAGLGPVAVQVFRAEEATFAATTTEGRQRLSLRGSWREETSRFAPGALFVPSAQPRLRLLMTLLEPEAGDSLAAWGLFNAHFEKKEYMEGYVAESVARDMLNADPALRGEFERRLAADPAFAADPSARLEFFHRRHASWDEAYLRYPIVRLDTAPP